MHPASEVPCRRIKDCWHERVDITGFLDEVLTPGQKTALQARPKQKIPHLLELIELSRNRR